MLSPIHRVLLGITLIIAGVFCSFLAGIMLQALIEGRSAILRISDGADVIWIIGVILPLLVTCVVASVWVFMTDVISIRRSS